MLRQYTKYIYIYIHVYTLYTKLYHIHKIIIFKIALFVMPVQDQQLLYNYRDNCIFIYIYINIHYFVFVVSA